MNLSPLQNFLWIVENALTLILCALVFARGLHHRFPLFGAYVVLLLAEIIAVRWTYLHWGYASQAARYAYWSSLGTVLFARALAVGEVCWRSLRDSPGVWGIVRKPLGLLALILFVYAALSAAKNNSPWIAFLLTAERCLDFGIVVVLVALVAVGTRYKAWLADIERDLILGFGVYSSFQVINDAFMEKWMMRYFHWWVSASMVSFEIAMAVWIVPLLRPLPPVAAPPTLFSEKESAAVLGQMLEQLRNIKEEMKRIARSKWK